MWQWLATNRINDTFHTNMSKACCVNFRWIVFNLQLSDQPVAVYGQSNHPTNWGISALVSLGEVGYFTEQGSTLDPARNASSVCVCV